MFKLRWSKRILLGAILLSLASVGGAARADQTDSSQGLAWTVRYSADFTTQAAMAPTSAPGATLGTTALVDEQGGNWFIEPDPALGVNVLKCQGARAGAGAGSSGYLDLPAAGAPGEGQTANQRIIIKTFTWNRAWATGIGLRINAPQKALYSAQQGPGYANGYIFDTQYTGGGAPGLPTGSRGPYSVPPPTGEPGGHYLRIDVSAVTQPGGAGTTIAQTVTDLGTSRASTTGPVIFAGTSGPDLSPHLQGAGQAGLVSLPGQEEILSFQSLTNGVYTPAPVSAATAALVSVGPLFVKVSTEAAAGGVGPYTYALYRSPLAGFVPGAHGILVGKPQTGVAAGVTPAPVTDRGFTTWGLWYYKWLVTDSGGGTSYTPRVTAAVPDKNPRTSDGYWHCAKWGDSRTQGDAGTNIWRQYAVAQGTRDQGSGYSLTKPPLITLTNPPGFGTSGTPGSRTAHFVAVVDPLGSGKLLGAYPDDRGAGYGTVIQQSAASGVPYGPALTISNANGAPGTGAAFFVPAPGGNTATGGGTCLAIEQYLSAWNGYHAVTVYDGGVDGIHASSFCGSAPPYTAAHPFVPSSLTLILLAECGSPTNCPAIIIDIGINDAVVGGPTPPDVYGQELQGVVSYLTHRGYKVVLDYPYWSPNAGDAGLDHETAYQGQINAVVARDPTRVVLGDTTTFTYSASDPALLFEQGSTLTGALHGNDMLVAGLASRDAAAVAPLIGLPMSLHTPAGRVPPRRP